MNAGTVAPPRQHPDEAGGGGALPSACAIGIDVGGTKCAAGAVVLPEGRVLARRLQPSAPGRGGDAVLADVIGLAQSLIGEVARQEYTPSALGIGVAELVDRAGRVVSEATIRWKGVPVGERVRAATSLPTRVDADVRAAARAEARLGPGRAWGCFLYVTVGTGISAALVLHGSPYLGARGLTGTFASSPVVIPGGAGDLVSGPPLERFASGPALAARFAEARPGFRGTAADVLELAGGGDEAAREVAASAGRALGAAVAHLVNTLDPAAVVVGGGLGLAAGLYRESLERAMRESIWSDLHRDLPLLPAALGNDAGWVGAALAALT
jgi:glucokinase